MINIVLIVLFFILKAIGDKIMFHFNVSIFSKIKRERWKYWKFSESWKNKWKNGDKKQGEKFIGSSTVFVMFTDAWHLITFIQYNILSLLLTLNSSLTFCKPIDYIIYLVGGLLIFEFFFSIILKKHE